eukprot:COSAG01_NODE_18631_length_1063_cov_1.399378_1_plen_94_part_10
MKTITGEAVVLAGCDLPRAVDAICSLMPLDFFVDCPALYMAPDPGVELPPLGAEVHEALKGCIQKHAAGVTRWSAAAGCRCGLVGAAKSCLSKK